MRARVMIEKTVLRIKNIFNKIISDHWEEFKKKHPIYNRPQYNDPIEKTLKCGMEDGGYTEYRCCECGNGTKRIPFSCKSCFCLSCSKVYVDDVVSQVSKSLHVGVRYRHIVLTMPEQLRIYFYHNRQEGKLLTMFMRAGYKCLENAVSVMLRKEIKIGCVMVVQTHGRKGGYNPHLHVIMSSGGVETESGKWKELKYINYDMLHKKWQYYLLKLMREWDNSKEMNKLIDELYKKYPKGFVANASRGEAPQKAKGLARYLAKYVASPPISVRRIMKYDGEKVTYKYKDHKTSKEKVETVTSEVFVGRMVQHILPKGFQRIRYYGLQATKTAEKWIEVIEGINRERKVDANDAYEIVKEKKYKERYKEGCGKDPFKCTKCGGEMILWKIWHPKYGVIYSEEKRIRQGQYTNRAG
jgi:hypothetical protein